MSFQVMDQRPREGRSPNLVNQDQRDNVKHAWREKGGGGWQAVVLHSLASSIGSVNQPGLKDFTKKVDSKKRKGGQVGLQGKKKNSRYPKKRTDSLGVAPGETSGSRWTSGSTKGKLTSTEESEEAQSGQDGSKKH